MPSLLIHLAIAKRYTELHPGKILNQNEFEKGSIAPDFDKNFSRILSATEKEVTHYYFSPDSDAVDFEKFKRDPNVDLTDDFWKGYYLHLLADHFFYTSVFKQEYEQSLKDGVFLYNDYSVLTPRIVEDYHLDLNSDHITDTVKECLAAKSGECRYLNYEKLRNFIEDIAAKA